MEDWAVQELPRRHPGRPHRKDLGAGPALDQGLQVVLLYSFLTSLLDSLSSFFCNNLI